MNRIEALLAVATAYGTARRIGESRVSTLVLNDGKRLRQIRDGADIGSRRIDQAIDWFHLNWPDNAVWPIGVERPSSARDELNSAHFCG